MKIVKLNYLIKNCFQLVKKFRQNSSAGFQIKYVICLFPVYFNAPLLMSTFDFSSISGKVFFFFTS